MSPTQQILERRTHLRKFFTSIISSPKTAFISLWISIGEQYFTVKTLSPIAALHENHLKHSLLTNTNAYELRTLNWN
jgi:hypothetical protein